MIEVAPALRLASAPTFQLFQQVDSSPRGLTEAEASARLVTDGENLVEALRRPGWLADGLAAALSPFVALLICLDLVFVVLGDLRGALTVGTMAGVSIVLRVWQERRSARAVDALRTRTVRTATVRRRATPAARPVQREVPVTDLVVGDVLTLATGDVVPADVRLVTAHHLRVDSSILSGETTPTGKRAPRSAADRPAPASGPLDADALCCAGCLVVGGSATGVVVATGSDTYLGAIAAARSAPRPISSFDAGVRSVSWVLIRFMLVLVPIVFAVSGFTRGSWSAALLFAVSVAVGLTPEMLPAVVTTNLARGAVSLARRRVIVTRLGALQDLGAMTVLCTDKTGTLTENRIALAQCVDPAGQLDDRVGHYAWLAGRFGSGSLGALDAAIDAQHDIEEPAETFVEEIPFDHDRRLASVVLRDGTGQHLLITRGDPDAVLARCTLTPAELAGATRLIDRHTSRGMRVLAIACRRPSARLGGYGPADEHGPALVGFVGFADPTKPSATAAVAELATHQVTVKIVTGDTERVATRLAAEVGIAPGPVLLGAELDRLTDAELAERAPATSVFARVTPMQKARIVTALRSGDQVVGFLADGVNDTPALRAADVGVAVHSAVDVVKDAADVILGERDLAVLADGVVAGRRTLANTLKYVRATASSNFGNALSIVLASAFLPFLPMLPIQLLVQNLIYDLAQLAVPWDRVDPADLRGPRRWLAGNLVWFMLVFGPISSLFDLVTFGVLARQFGAGSPAHQALFQSGWFAEGLASQILVVLVMRSRHRRAGRGAATTGPSRALLVTFAVAVGIGVGLPFSALAPVLHLATLPIGYLPWLTGIVLIYCALVRVLRTGLPRRVEPPSPAAN